MVRTIASMVALASIVATTPAIAGSGHMKVEGRVSYSGLDLSDPADIAQLKQRISNKARLICRQGLPPELHFSPEVNDCRAGAEESGKAELARLVEHSRHHGGTGR